MGSITMITQHKRLQHYNKHYGSSCMTGSFGCRWLRYQQSKDITSMWDLAWFFLLVLVFSYVSIWLYFWLVCGENDYDYINWEISNEFQVNYRWYNVILGTCCAGFGYVSLLMLLALLHLANGHELYMHYVHKCILFMTAAGCITATVVVNNVYPQGWSLAYISMQVYGPFLHIGAVVVMTLLSWILARQWLCLYKLGARFIWLGVFISMMMCLYLSPIFIESACIYDSYLADAPLLSAHRGASALYPENTLLAYRYAVNLPNVVSIEADIQVSLDGVPFALHDLTLERTTNVQDVFPHDVKEHAVNFNISQLQKLNAGSWFIKSNPHGTVSKLSNAEKELVKNATIPTLNEILEIVANSNCSVMIRLSKLPETHPHAKDFKKIVVETITNFTINPKQVLWPDWDLDENQTANFIPISFKPVHPEELLQRHVHHVAVHYPEAMWNKIRMYQNLSITVGVYPVNSEWLHSLMHCAAVNVTHTDYVHIFTTKNNPIWKWGTETYFIIWLTVDIVSAFLIATIFVIQWFRCRGQVFNPETMLLQAAQQRVSQMRNRNMKEKLIHAAEGLQETEQGIVGMDVAETPVSEGGEVMASSSDLGNLTNSSCFIRSGSSTPSIQSINDIKLREIQAVCI